MGTASNLSRRAALALVCLPVIASASPSSTSQSGFIHMPDGRVADDGTLTLGGSHMSPYTALWGNITLFPGVEFSGRYTRVADVAGFDGTGGFGADFGNYKDKAFDLKVRLFRESSYLPAVAFGLHDFHGTGEFEGAYLAASKRYEMGYGAIDLGIGFGGGRFDGPFGGVRWFLPGDRFGLVAEWDGYDYQNDFYATQTGRALREGGLTLGVEYRRGWFFAQAAHQDGELGATVAVSLPLQQRSFVAKIDEPAPVPVEIQQRPDLAEWQADPGAMRPLYEALFDEGFAGTQALLDGQTLRVALSHSRMSTMGRAVGRAARLVALHAPDGVTRLELTFVSGGLPVTTYRFDDLALLRGYFTGTVQPDALQPTLSASYVDADAYRALRDEGAPWDEVIAPEERGPTIRASMVSRFGAFMVSPGADVPGAFRIQPLRINWLFNDPSGAIKYDLFSTASYSHRFTDNLYGVGALRLTLSENVSDAQGLSNSVLPHVRSDIALYHRQGSRVRMQSLHLGHIANPRDRIYTWLSAGYLEEGYAGVGGEVLYLPETGNWAADFAAFGVRKREYEGRFGFLDYQTVTAIGSFHYRIPRHGLTLTTRVGRFLARDNGVRFELKRRFLSGFEVGAWYSHTDAKDITSPGSPEDPYRDKGVFLRFAIGPFQTFDSGAAANFRISAWARDPGQMVHAPGGLYDLIERRLMLNLRDQGIWTDFGY